MEGAAVYLNQFINPAFFDGGDLTAEINRLSQRFGYPPRLHSLPRMPDLPEAVIAAWGDVPLDPLDEAAVEMLASGESPGPAF